MAEKSSRVRSLAELEGWAQNLSIRPFGNADEVARSQRTLIIDLLLAILAELQHGSNNG